MSTEDPAETEAQIPRSILGSLAFGTVLQPLNSSMIAVALVSIRDDFDAGVSVNWLVSALYIATAVAASTMGRLADLFGARRMFLIGLCFVLGGSVIAPFSPNLATLVACRVLLGLGTGAQYPCALAILRRTADRLGARPESALGVLSVAAQVSIAFGPSLGGLIVAVFSWQGIFWVNLPMCAAAAITVLRTVPADEPIDSGVAGLGRRGLILSRLNRVDPPGLLLFAAATATLMVFLLSLAQTPRPIWGVVSAALFVILILWERRVPSPFLDLSLFANAQLSLTFARVTVIYIAFYAIFFGVPQWLEEAGGRTPAQAGLIFLPIPLVAMGSTALAARLQVKRGPVLTIVIGAAVMCVAGVLLTRPTAGTPVILILLLLGLIGFPNGFNNMGNLSSMYRASPADQIGAASGLYRTCQYIGANLAAALLALVLGDRATDKGLHQMGWCVAAIAGAVLIGELIVHLRARGRAAVLRS